MTAKANIHDYAFEQMNRLLEKLAEQAHRAAATPGPDEIHDLRVSIRRFSQALELFEDFFAKEQVKEVRKLLKELMGLTSAVRDRDITLEFLKDAGHAGHQPRLEKERGTHQRQFSTMLNRWTKRDFQTEWRNGLALRNASKLKTSRTAAENAQEVLPKMARKYFHAGRTAMRSKPGELHRFRIATKRFRYTLELFRPAYGPQLDRYLESLRHLQGVLGKISDYQAIGRVLAGDKKLKLQLRQELKKRVKDLRQEWREFDVDGALKSWRLYLSRDHSPRPAKKIAHRKTA